MIKRIAKLFLYRVGLYKYPSPQIAGGDIERLREQGAIIGDIVDIIGAYLDYHHRALIKIGNNVTITHATLLAHDASTKKSWAIQNVVT